MSIEDKSVVDGITLRDAENAIAMLIYDDWNGNDEFEHMMLMQNKINAYLDYLETKQYLSIFPDHEFEYGIFEVYLKHTASENCLRLLNNMQHQLEHEGIRLDYFESDDFDGFDILNTEIDDVFYYNDEFEQFVAVINNIAFMTKRVTPEVKEYVDKLAKSYESKRLELIDYIYTAKEFKEEFPDISKSELEYSIGDPVVVVGESFFGECSFCNVRMANSPVFNVAFINIFDCLGNFGIMR